MSVKLFDEAIEVINMASERFAPQLKLNEERLDIFKGYCEAIDDIAKRNDGIAYDIDVSEETCEVSIALECDEIIVERDDPKTLYDLCERTLRYEIYESKDENLVIKFVFPSLWERDYMNE